MKNRLIDKGLISRAAIHAALGDPARLALVEELIVSDRSPKELGSLIGLESNLLAHHLDVLEEADLIIRCQSSGDGRRKYVQLKRDAVPHFTLTQAPSLPRMLFVCTQNSARSQLAAAIWTDHTGTPATSSGTNPATSIHVGALQAAKRAGLSLTGASPKKLGAVSASTQVVTVCDLVHEELQPNSSWWHWSIPDPVVSGKSAAFDNVVQELRSRVEAVASALKLNERAS